MRSAVTAGTTVAGFRLESLIGEGAMGAVYRAEDTRRGGRAAVKILMPQLAHDERFRRRFFRESGLAASLDHPHIVPVIDAGEQDGVLYLAMRYIEGSDLRHLLRREGRLDPERALRLVEQVAAALDAAHDAGLVHRDVKPGNILITDEDRAYVCDFGLARHVSTASSLTTDRGLIGTIDYIPPEQIEGGAIDGRADVYSLGCLLFECLAGARPFERESDLSVVFAHLNEAPPELSDLRPDLPSALDDVLASALAKAPKDRYSSCGELVSAARAALHGERVAPSKVRRRGLLLTAALLAAAGAVLAGVLLVGGNGAGATSITPTSIAGAPLGLEASAYKGHFGRPWTSQRLPESEHTKLTFPDEEVAVYFKGLTDTSVEITTWNPAYKTAEGIGPCSTLRELKKAYGKRLKPSKFNTQNGVVFAYTVGTSLIFASNQHANVEVVAVYYGQAPDSDQPGGSLSFAGYIALVENACPGSKT
jgi:predicted Ser/Thr protein kinase